MMHRFWLPLVVSLLFVSEANATHFDRCWTAEEVTVRNTEIETSMEAQGGAAVVIAPTPADDAFKKVEAKIARAFPDRAHPDAQFYSMVVMSLNDRKAAFIISGKDMTCFEDAEGFNDEDLKVLNSTDNPGT